MTALHQVEADDTALIERLLALPNPRGNFDWHKEPDNYLTNCPFSRDDIPGLIRVMQHWPDESWPDKEAFPPPLRENAELLSVTAWRVLGELHAAEAVPPLIELLRGLSDGSIDDWSTEEWPILFAQLGPSAIEPILEVARDAELTWDTRSLAVSGLRQLAEKHPETREQIVPRLVEMMEQAEEANQRLNSVLLMELVDLHAVEAAEAIERAFSRNAIDHGMMGDWEKVRQTLGVGSLGLPMPEHPHNSVREWREKLNLSETIERMKRQIEQEQNIIANEYAVRDSQTPMTAPLQRLEKLGRNDPCSCGSGKKYKKCCGRAY